MKQVTRLKIFFALSIVLGVIVTAVQVWQFINIKSANIEQDIAFELIEKTSQLELILHEISLRTVSEDSMEIWMEKHKELSRVLATSRSSVINKKEFDKIQYNFVALRQLIADINWEEKACELTLDTICTSEQNLDDFIDTTKELVSSAISFANVARAYAREKRNIMHITAVGFGAFVTFALIFLALFLGKRIIYSINILRDGTHEISSGNLDFRVQDLGEDEFGELAKRFNTMMEKLKLVTASKDELNKEVIRRQKIEEELKNYQQFLENRVATEVDIRREKEMQLLEQTKSAQMGEMLTNIAHHWRQPLNVIGLYIQEIRDSKRYGELTDEYLDELVSKAMIELTNVSKTLDKFRKFSISKNSDESFDLKEVVEKSIDLIKPLLISKFIEIDFVLKGCEQKEPCSGNENSLMQAIYNILINSKEALEANNIKNRKISVVLDIGKESANITIIDNAGGIDKSIINRIFDPFFTTKGNVNKTGTGLYFTKLIVENEFHGKVVVNNRSDGVEFTITLTKSCNKGAKNEHT